MTAENIDAVTVDVAPRLRRIVVRLKEENMHIAVEYPRGQSLSF